MVSSNKDSATYKTPASALPLAKLAEAVLALEGVTLTFEEAQAIATAAFRCSRCKGDGEVYRGCSYCGDSTYDHECNDRVEPCSRCDARGWVVPEHLRGVFTRTTDKDGAK